MIIRSDAELAGMRAVGRLVAETLAHLEPHHENTIVVLDGALARIDRGLTEP